jgi:hypothetical protein
MYVLDIPKGKAPANYPVGLADCIFKSLYAFKLPIFESLYYTIPNDPLMRYYVSRNHKHGTVEYRYYYLVGKGNFVHVGRVNE